MGDKKCPYIDTCDMFKRFTTESAKKVFITLYCKGNFKKCARKKLRDSGQPVPENLLPSGKFI